MQFGKLLVCRYLVLDRLGAGGVSGGLARLRRGARAASGRDGSGQRAYKRCSAVAWHVGAAGSALLLAFSGMSGLVLAGTHQGRSATYGRRRSRRGSSRRTGSVMYVAAATAKCASRIASSAACTSATGSRWNWTRPDRSEPWIVAWLSSVPSHQGYTNVGPSVPSKTNSGRTIVSCRTAACSPRARRSTSHDRSLAGLHALDRLVESVNPREVKYVDTYRPRRPTDRRMPCAAGSGRAGHWCTGHIGDPLHRHPRRRRRPALGPLRRRQLRQQLPYAIEVGVRRVAVRPATQPYSAPSPPAEPSGNLVRLVGVASVAPVLRVAGLLPG
jgi:hypothetical protein